MHFFFLIHKKFSGLKTRLSCNQINFKPSITIFIPPLVPCKHTPVMFEKPRTPLKNSLSFRTMFLVSFKCLQTITVYKYSNCSQIYEYIFLIIQRMRELFLLRQNNTLEILPDQQWTFSNNMLAWISPPWPSRELIPGTNRFKAGFNTTKVHGQDTNNSYYISY